MLNLLKLYEAASEEDRIKRAVPFIFFEKCTHGGRAKGNAIFHGFGVLESAELVTQYGPNNEYFSNYRFNPKLFTELIFDRF